MLVLHELAGRRELAALGTSMDTLTATPKLTLFTLLGQSVCDRPTQTSDADEPVNEILGCVDPTYPPLFALTDIPGRAAA